MIRLISLVLAFNAPLAFAFNLNANSARPLAPIAKGQHAEETCVDLSGTWKGVCQEVSGTEEPVTSEETMVVKQNKCFSLDIDGLTYQFGGSHTETDTSANDTMSTAIMIDWNQEKSAVNLVLSFQGRALGAGPFSIYTGTGNGSVKIVDTKLVASLASEIVFTTEAGVSTTRKSVQSCTYEKQQ